jgi:hypothetical protein
MMKTNKQTPQQKRSAEAKRRVRQALKYKHEAYTRELISLHLIHAPHGVDMTFADVATHLMHMGCPLGRNGISYVLRDLGYILSSGVNNVLYVRKVELRGAVTLAGCFREVVS